jgi:hypothetical protein
VSDEFLYVNHDRTDHIPIKPDNLTYQRHEARLLFDSLRRRCIKEVCGIGSVLAMILLPGSAVVPYL